MQTQYLPLVLGLEVGMTLPEIRLMQAAIALAEERNYSRAAERLHVGQSSLTKQIQELESLVGMKLFQRSHQDVQLTEAGRRFLEDARSTVLYAERALLNAASSEHGADDVLHLGRSVYADPYLVRMLQSTHLSLFPGLKIKLWSNYSHELTRMVATGKLDMALVTSIPDNPAISFLKVSETPVYIAMPKTIPIAERSELYLEDLRNYEWVLFAEHVNPHLFEMIQTAAASKRIRACDMHYVMVAEEAVELVRTQNCIAFLTRDSAWRIGCDDIAVRPLAEDCVKLVTRLATRVDSKTPYVGEFLRSVGGRMSKTPWQAQSPLPLAG